MINNRNNAARLLNWLCIAASSPGRGSLYMAVVIAQLSTRLERDQHIMVMARTLKAHRINRSSAWRAMKQLEEAGLITVRRRQGTSPLVSIVWSDHDE